jgi:hypothetical protein
MLARSSICHCHDDSLVQCLAYCTCSKWPNGQEQLECFCSITFQCHSLIFHDKNDCIFITIYYSTLNILGFSSPLYCYNMNMICTLRTDNANMFSICKDMVGKISSCNGTSVKKGSWTSLWSPKSQSGLKAQKWLIQLTFHFIPCLSTKPMADWEQFPDLTQRKANQAKNINILPSTRTEVYVYLSNVMDDYLGELVNRNPSHTRPSEPSMSNECMNKKLLYLIICE